MWLRENSLFPQADSKPHSLHALLTPLIVKHTRWELARVIGQKGSFLLAFEMRLSENAA